MHPPGLPTTDIRKPATGTDAGPDDVPGGLRTRIAYRWRQLRTGIAFAVFGIAGLVFAPLVLVPLCLTARGPDRTKRRAQWVMSRWFRAFAHLMRLLGLIDWHIEGAEKLRTRGQLIIANHPTLIDVVLLLGYMPQVDCIVKETVFRNPFMGRAVSWAGYISNSTATQVVADCAETLRKGNSLLIFPEGTRSVPGQPIRIPHAAARIALESGAPVLPVNISCEPITLFKGQPWYRVADRQSLIRLQVGEAYSPEPWLREAPSMAIAARRLSRHWETSFTDANARLLRLSSGSPPD